VVVPTVRFLISEHKIGTIFCEFNFFKKMAKKSIKEMIGYGVLAVWVAVTSFYFVRGLYFGLQSGMTEQFALQVQAQTVGAVIQEAEKCEEFPLRLEEYTINLKKVGCEAPAAE